MLHYTYLAEEADLKTFGPNQLANYKYIALVGVGKNAASLSQIEYQYVRATLGHFMKDDCLVLMEEQLKQAPKDSFIRSIYTDLPPAQNEEGYVGISTVFNHVNPLVRLRPIYQTIQAEDTDGTRYPFLEAVNCCLDQLKEALYFRSLEDFPLPTPKTKALRSVTPFGSRIRRLRSKIGSYEEVAQIRSSLGSTSEETLKSVERFNPTEPENLKVVAAILGVAVESIMLDQVVLDRVQLVEFRQQTTLDKTALASAFGIGSAFFFDLLETAPVAPTSTLRFVHNQYKRVLERRTLTAAKLINIDATEKWCD